MLSPLNFISNAPAVMPLVQSTQGLGFQVDIGAIAIFLLAELALGLGGLLFIIKVWRRSEREYKDTQEERLQGWKDLAEQRAESIDDLRKEYQEIVTQCERRIQDNLTKCNQKVQEVVIEKEVEFKVLQKQYDLIASEVTAFRLENATLRGDNVRLTTENTKLIALVADLQKQVEVLTERIEKLQKKD